jgi:hypothetical protein
MLVSSVPAAHYSAPHGATTTSGPRPHYRSFTITLRHTALGRTTLDEGSARYIDPYLTTHSTQIRQKIRTRNPSKWVAANPRLRPCGYSDLTLYLGGIDILLDSLFNRNVGSRRCWWYSNEWGSKMVVMCLEVRPGVCETSRWNEMLWSSSKRAPNNWCGGRNSNRVFCSTSQMR